MHFVPILQQEIAEREWRRGGETLVFELIILSLIAGALAYELSRLGYYARLCVFKEPDQRTLRRFAYGGKAPSLTLLVPSFKEEIKSVTQTLFSAALQNYPSKRIVLLIDDPPFPETEADQERLVRARKLGAELLEMVREQRKKLEDGYRSFRIRANKTPGEYRELVSEAYRSSSYWLRARALQCPVADHTDRLFVTRVLRNPARLYMRYARMLKKNRSLGVENLELYHRQIISVFSFDISVFERKRYENLSHAPNKAMNINSYLGLMGGRYGEVLRGGKLHLEARPDGVIVPESDYVATLDADSLLAHDYALKLIYVLERPGNERVAVIQTPYSSFPGSQSVVERIAGATTDVQHVIHQGFTFFNATYWVGANAIIRAKALADIKTEDVERSFPIARYVQDRTVIEDTESSIDLIRKGWTLFNYPRRLSYSATPPDFGSLLIQRRRWANGGLIILPKLLAHLFRNVARPREFFLSGFLRIHYLASIALVNFGTLALLLYPFGDDLLNPWMFIAALCYYYLYGRDLVLLGYRGIDIFRVYVLNLLLLPINVGGVLKSIQQGITGRKIPFARTPKVQGRTAAPPLYVIAEYLILFNCIASLFTDLSLHRYFHMAFVAANGLCFVYVMKMIGFRDSILALMPRMRAKRTAVSARSGLDLLGRFMPAAPNARESQPREAAEAVEESAG